MLFQNFKRNPIKAIISMFSILGLRAYFKALFNYPKHDIKKFVVFAQGRSGSTFLCELLDSHPDIRCDGELLNVRWRGRKIFPAFYVKCVAKTSKLMVYGFHVKVYQLYSQHGVYQGLHQNVDPKKFLFNLHRSGWKIIYLKRNNIFRQAVSNFVAEESKKYHFTNKDGLNLPKIKINVEELLKYIQGREENLIYEKEILKMIPHLKLIYETDLLTNTEKGFNKIFKYLKVRPFPVKSNLRRTSKDDMRDYIINYDEIAIELSNTKYSKFIDK